MLVYTNVNKHIVIFILKGEINMKKKTIICFVTSLILTTCTIIPAMASDTIKVVVNNENVSFDVPPQVINGRTMVPMRTIFEKLGATVDWDGVTKTITGKKDNTIVKMTIGESKINVNGNEVILDVPANIVSGRTLVPARAIAESFCCKVEWNGDSKTVVVSSGNENVIKHSIEGNKLIEVDGGNLSGHREPNVVVDIGYGNREYYAFTNEFGQLVRVTADKIILQDDSIEPVLSTGRYYPDEAKVPGVESPNLDEGHVIADSLGGVSNAYNITPQNSILNRHGDQAYMEKWIRDAGGCSNFEAIITYPNTKTQIPSKYKFTYTLKGNVVVDEFQNINPDEAVSTKKSQEITTPSTPAVSAPEVTKGDLSKIDTNGNGIVTISEAKKAGYSMPITSAHWLYKYMRDSDGDGMVGE